MNLALMWPSRIWVRCRARGWFVGPLDTALMWSCWVRIRCRKWWRLVPSLMARAASFIDPSSFKVGDCRCGFAKTTLMRPSWVWLWRWTWWRRVQDVSSEPFPFEGWTVRLWVSKSRRNVVMYKTHSQSAFVRMIQKERNCQ